MKNLELENYGVVEMNSVEMMSVDAGYFEYYWSGTDNPLIYAGQAAYNGGVAICNGSMWLWSKL